VHTSKCHLLLNDNDTYSNIFLEEIFLSFGIRVLGKNRYMTKKILSFSKLNLCNGTTEPPDEFLYLEKDFTTRPKLVYDKLVLKFVRLKWVYLWRISSVSKVYNSMSLNKNIVPKFHNTHLSFKSYKIMGWHVLTSIVST
jgi:hypothetical protein